jgi:peptide/nickel transport system substrate-binding protein
MIERIDVIDDDTVDFYIAQADPLFPGYLTIGIVPAGACEQNMSLARQPQGSGTFIMRNWPDSGLLRLQRKRDEQLFEMITVGDATVRVLKLLRGEIDIIQNDLPVELIHYLQQQQGIAVRFREGSNFSYLGLNMQDSDLSRLAVRRAIAHAIDRNAIIEYMLPERSRTANALLSPSHWASPRELKAYDYDPQRAQQLLAEAGYDSQHPLQLEYKTSSNPLQIRIATIIQQQLNEVGIQVSLRSLDWATVYGDIKAGRFQIYLLSWVGIKNPDIFRYVFHSASVPPAGANRGRYHNSAVDSLIEQADAATDLEIKATLYRQLQQRLLTDLPYIPLWYTAHVMAASDAIQGYDLTPDGNYDDLNRVIKHQ